MRLRAEMEKTSGMIADLDELEELVSVLLTSSKLQNGVWAIHYTEINIKSLLYEVLAKVDVGGRNIHKT